MSRAVWCGDCSRDRENERRRQSRRKNRGRCSDEFDQTQPFHHALRMNCPYSVVVATAPPNDFGTCDSDYYWVERANRRHATSDCSKLNIPKTALLT